MICTGDIKSVEFVDLKKSWSLAQEDAQKKGRRLCSTKEIQNLPKTSKKFIVQGGQLASCSKSMDKCTDDEYDFVSLSGSGANYGQSWRKANPD